jgi:hypothetical protein
MRRCSQRKIREMGRRKGESKKKRKKGERWQREIGGTKVKEKEGKNDGS